MSLKIVPFKMKEAGQVDVAAVIGIIRATRKLVQPEVWTTAFKARGIVQDWFEVPKTGSLLARGLGDRIEGCLVMRGEEGGLRLVHLGARPQRKGVGSYLLKGPETLAKKKGTPEIRAAILPDHPMHRGFFLDKHGFELTDTEVDVEGDMWKDAVKKL